MTTSDLAAAVIDTIELQLGRVGVQPADRFIDELEADSFDLMNVVALVEERHAVTISEEQAAGFVTVADLISHVEAEANR